MCDAPHILVLEDRADTAHALEHLLKRAGYRVTTAGTLARAREAVGQCAFDLAIADLDLPDGSGMDLLPALHRRFRPTPAIALTGYDDAAASYAAGFAEHLTKPIEFADLLAIIARLIDRRRGPSANPPAR
ncbi:MAG TPA: response regulator [Tepidisphaeraceae bacterium]|jgi:DNA-binding NtrC family response regulator